MINFPKYLDLIYKKHRWYFLLKTHLVNNFKCKFNNEFLKFLDKNDCKKLLNHSCQI